MVVVAVMRPVAVVALVALERQAQRLLFKVTELLLAMAVQLIRTAATLLLLASHLLEGVLGDIIPVCPELVVVRGAVAVHQAGLLETLLLRQAQALQAKAMRAARQTSRTVAAVAAVLAVLDHKQLPAVVMAAQVMAAPVWVTAYEQVRHRLMAVVAAGLVLPVAHLGLAAPVAAVMDNAVTGPTALQTRVVAAALADDLCVQV